MVGNAIITAVNTGSKTLTVDFQNSTTPGYLIPWIAGAAMVEVPIPITLIWCPITAGFPHYLKSWTRVNFWFNGGNFQLITAGFITDIQGTTQYLDAIPTGARVVFGLFWGRTLRKGTSEPSGQVIQDFGSDRC